MDRVPCPGPGWGHGMGMGQRVPVLVGERGKGPGNRDQGPVSRVAPHLPPVD